LVNYAKNSGCKYLKTSYQSGYDALPFNLGVQYATGEYICRVDSDDILLELPSKIDKDIVFGNIDRVDIPQDLTIEELILAPRALFGGMIIKREIAIEYPLVDDLNIFTDVLLVLSLLYHNYSFTINKNINYIYRKRKNSIQTSQSALHHRLRHIQTVARFCKTEDIEATTSIHYLELAMLNLKYGSNSRNRV
jgi:hypothetical protein